MSHLYDRRGRRKPDKRLIEVPLREYVMLYACLMMMAVTAIVACFCATRGM